MKREKRSDIEIEGIKVEQRLARTIERALRKLQASVSLNDLTIAIQRKDIKSALSLFSMSELSDALTPSVKIVQDATMKGGRIAARQVKNG